MGSLQSFALALIHFLSVMQYRCLGKTGSRLRTPLMNAGIKVSVLGWGNYCNDLDSEQTFEIMKTLFSFGVNHFDTAEVLSVTESCLHEDVQRWSSRKRTWRSHHQRDPRRPVETIRFSYFYKTLQMWRRGE